MDYRSSRLPPPVWKRSALVCWPAIWGQIDQFISFRATPRLSWAGRSPKKICVCCLRNTSPPCARCSRKVHTETANADLLRSEEHTSELQSRGHLVCRLL